MSSTTSEEYTHSEIKKTSHSPAKIKVLTALLLNVPVYRDVTPYWLEYSYWQALGSCDREQSMKREKTNKMQQLDVYY
jgi:hypothetical protein